MLLCVGVMRPLHSELAVEVITKITRKLIADNAGSKQTEEARSDVTALCARILGSLVCPSTFFREMTSQLMAQLIANITWPSSASLLEYIICHQMALYRDASDWLEPIKEELTHALVRNLGVFYSKTRLKLIR